MWLRFSGPEAAWEIALEAEDSPGRYHALRAILQAPTEDGRDFWQSSAREEEA
jgi:hypothetical protein